MTPDSFAAVANLVGAQVEATREVAARLLSAWLEVEESLVILPTHRRWLADRIPVIARAFA